MAHFFENSSFGKFAALLRSATKNIRFALEILNSPKQKFQISFKNSFKIHWYWNYHWFSHFYLFTVNFSSKTVPFWNYSFIFFMITKFIFVDHFDVIVSDVIMTSLWRHSHSSPPPGWFLVRKSIPWVSAWDFQDQKVHD